MTTVGDDKSLEVSSLGRAGAPSHNSNDAESSCRCSNRSSTRSRAALSRELASGAGDPPPRSSPAATCGTRRALSAELEQQRRPGCQQEPRNHRFGWQRPSLPRSRESTVPPRDHVDPQDHQRRLDQRRRVQTQAKLTVLNSQNPYTCVHEQPGQGPREKPCPQIEPQEVADRGDHDGRSRRFLRISRSSRANSASSTWGSWSIRCAIARDDDPPYSRSTRPCSNDPPIADCSCVAS